MKKLMVLFAFLAPSLSSATALKYICTVDSGQNFNQGDSSFAIVYANDYELVYPEKSWCMSHLNLITCEFTHDGFNYRLEIDIENAYSPIYQNAGKVTKSRWIKSVQSPVSCYLRE